MLKGISRKRRLEEAHHYFFSHAVELYVDFYKAKKNIDLVYIKNRDIKVENYSSLCKLSLVIEKWFIENIDPNILIKIANEIKIPNDNTYIGNAFLINELYLSNKTYKQFEGLIPLTISDFNNSKINEAYNLYKSSLKTVSDFTYKDAQVVADEKLKIFNEYVREIYSDYFSDIASEFLDEVIEQAKYIVDSEVK